MTTKAKKRIGIFVIAYNAVNKLDWTLDRIPESVWENVDEVFLFDDCSTDNTYYAAIGYKHSKQLDKLTVHRNTQNLRYGGNQKAGYQYAIERGFDIVVMLHADGQYAPEVLPQLLEPLEDDEADVVLGSRMAAGGNPLKGGMPFYKYLGNRILTGLENRIVGMNLAEFHSGYRLYSCEALKKVPFLLSSNEWHFDTDILIQFHAAGLRIVERPIPTYYGDEICYVAPRLGADWFRAAERRFTRFARRRALSIVTVGLLALAGRAALLPQVPVPEPGAHDEFAYLLAADTFASGRLTNPTHPMWVHFESFHIIQKPTYNSMYPIASSVMMALGKVLFGHPWWGVWLSAGIFCGALCWMLQGWLPPQWALLGGLIAVVRVGLFSYWMNSYMGGAMAGIGGVLVLGALPRIMRRPRAVQAVVMGIGIIILANSRPNEGFFTALGPLAVLMVWVFRNRLPRRRVLTQIALPLGSVLVLMCIGMGFYFWRVAGSPLRMPYQVNRSTYATAPVFFFQTPAVEPHYNHLVMRDFYQNWEQALYVKTQSPVGVLVRTAGKFVTLWLFYFGPVLSLPLLMLHRVLRDRRLRPLIIAGAIGLLGFFLPAWFNAHYAAPLAGLFYAAMLQGVRHLRWCRPRGSGLLLARAVPLICLLLIPVRIFAGPLHLSLNPNWRLTWSSAAAGNYDRAELLRRLEQLPGRHLVIVRYQPDHDFHSEWVYNEANIDGAKVVWAREMDPQHNRELTSSFKDRKIWLLEADVKPSRLHSYPGADPGNPQNLK